MFRTARIVHSLRSDWEYPVSKSDIRDLEFLQHRHAKIKHLPAVAAAGMFLCHKMKRDYEFTSAQFPDLLIRILNLPVEAPERLEKHHADALLDAAGAALSHHRHPYLETFAEYLRNSAA
jgi:hypothetical protein